ncbi:MAG: c-type cytochrome [Bryobacteraceae bacterium]
MNKLTPLTIAAFLLFAAEGSLPVNAQAKPAKKSSANATSAETGPVARGRYIVEGVARCERCHTPRKSDGELDIANRLMGSPVQMTPTYPGPQWALRAPRLAGRPPGTDEEFIRLLSTGISRTGRPPNPPMPHFRLTRDDAQAVLAYLKSLPR